MTAPAGAEKGAVVAGRIHRREEAMKYENNEQVFNFVSGLLLGAAIGAGIAMLTAPQSGRRTRKKIRRAAGDLKFEAGDRWDELADDVKARVDDAVRSARTKMS